MFKDSDWDIIDKGDELMTCSGIEGDAYQWDQNGDTAISFT